MNTKQRNLVALRILLYVLFLVAPSYSVVASTGLWLLITIWGLGFIAVVSLNYWPGYMAMMATLVGGAISNSPLIFFAPAFCMVFMFVIGTSSIRKQWEVATQLIPGTTENVTHFYSLGFQRFAKKFFAVTSILLAFAFAYAVLPTLVPTPSDATVLALYVVLTLVALAIVLRLASS